MGRPCDLSADRYFCLARNANAAFLRLAVNAPMPGDGARLDGLTGRGVLVDDIRTTALGSRRRSSNRFAT